MKILGIDPGNTFSAGVILDDGRIVDKQRLQNADFLRWLDDVKCGQITLRGYESKELRVAAEMVACYGMTAGATLFETCVFLGRCQAIFPEMALVTRVQVKTELCRSARAKDQNVRQALIDIYGPPGTRKNPGGTFGVSADIWSALAVATAYGRGCPLYESAASKHAAKTKPT